MAMALGSPCRTGQSSVPIPVAGSGTGLRSLLPSICEWGSVWHWSCWHLKGAFVFFDFGMSQTVTSKKLRKGLQDTSSNSGKTRDKCQACPAVALEAEAGTYWISTTGN